MSNRFSFGISWQTFSSVGIFLIISNLREQVTNVLALGASLLQAVCTDKYVPPKASLKSKSAWSLLCTNSINNFTLVTFRVTLAWYEKCKNETSLSFKEILAENVRSATLCSAERALSASICTGLSKKWLSCVKSPLAPWQVHATQPTFFGQPCIYIEKKLNYNLSAPSGSRKFGRIISKALCCPRISGENNMSPGEQ